MAWTDGAHLGVPAHDAMAKILADRDVPDDVPMDVETFRAWILDCPPPPYVMGDEGYTNVARWVAKRMLALFTEYPAFGTRPLDEVYDACEPWDWPENQSPTGFQVGWGWNAARRCVELPPGPNPAMVEIGP